jgi:hypothetical protein
MIRSTDKTLASKELVFLIGEGRYYDARKLADEIVRLKILPETSVNSSCYYPFRRLFYQDKENARKLSEIFRDYRWDCWYMRLEEEKQKAIKGEEASR